MEAFGVRRETVAFVMPTGYSFNLGGSSLYQSLALFFIAQVAGIHLTIGQQTVMLLTLLISNKGTAGVARVSLVVVGGCGGRGNPYGTPGRAGLEFRRVGPRIFAARWASEIAGVHGYEARLRLGNIGLRSPRLVRRLAAALREHHPRPLAGRIMLASDHSLKQAHHASNKDRDYRSPHSHAP